MWAAWARAPRVNKRFALAIAAKLLRAVRRVNILHLIVLAVLQDSALLATLYVRKEDRLQRRVQNSLNPDCTDLSAAPRSGVDRRRPAAHHILSSPINKPGRAIITGVGLARQRGNTPWPPSIRSLTFRSKAKSRWLRSTLRQ